LSRIGQELVKNWDKNWTRELDKRIGQENWTRELDKRIGQELPRIAKKLQIDKNQQKSTKINKNQQK
jgi:hypothetical protein